VQVSYAVSPVWHFVTEFRLSAEPLENVAAAAKSRANPVSTQQRAVAGSAFILMDGGARLMAPLLFRSKGEVVQRLTVSHSLISFREIVKVKNQGHVPRCAVIKQKAKVCYDL
jgi:hypothetical protein